MSMDISGKAKRYAFRPKHGPLNWEISVTVTPPQESGKEQAQLKEAVGKSSTKQPLQQQKQHKSSAPNALSWDKN
jgi:hypothetical protein